MKIQFTDDTINRNPNTTDSLPLLGNSTHYIRGGQTFGEEYHYMKKNTMCHFELFQYYIKLKGEKSLFI